VWYSEDGRPQIGNLAEELYLPNPFIGSLASKRKLCRRRSNETQRREFLLRVDILMNRTMAGEVFRRDVVPLAAICILPVG
jgi:hypothetical protein